MGLYSKPTCHDVAFPTGLPNPACIAVGGNSFVIFFFAGNDNQYEFTFDSITTSSLTIAGTLPPGQAGVTYGPVPFVSGGTPPYKVSAINAQLPAGLTVDPLGGFVFGIVKTQVPDTWLLTAAVSDNAGATAMASKVMLKVYCGDPNKLAPGDDRDRIIKQYVVGTSPYPSGVPFQQVIQKPPGNVVGQSAVNAPHCDQFAAKTDFFTRYYPDFPSIVSKPGSTAPTYPYSYAFTILDGMELGITGIDAWITSLETLPGGDPYCPVGNCRVINSSYRNPQRNVDAGSKATTSPHMLGVAIDLGLTPPKGTAAPLAARQLDWDRLVIAATLAGVDRIEGVTFAKNPKSTAGLDCIRQVASCVHVDWRPHAGQSFLHP